MPRPRGRRHGGKRTGRRLGVIDSINIHHIKAARNVVEGNYGSAAENLFRAAKANQRARRGA